MNWIRALSYVKKAWPLLKYVLIAAAEAKITEVVKANPDEARVISGIIRKRAGS